MRFQPLLKSCPTGIYLWLGHDFKGAAFAFHPTSLPFPLLLASVKKDIRLELTKTDVFFQWLLFLQNGFSTTIIVTQFLQERQ
ncbi:hypothetical protein SAMN02799630_04479 [Paenibacillus sp. UNCCL117]|uniref:hypothetical protein n=1 Tax=unclassified Paenibacillus TaxID=185978 RepID=UPI0008878E31|nr:MULTISPECIES: hypothetical protein [unclassified Paenibacillus]SDE03870.1 hypothetical protein SAMN04488602_11788 [Paenibacillus sp. cl123]SFW57507.1 hypothetical protein SAMN02799630_04479 [Paenibacillus sp. UNCCL117]